MKKIYFLATMLLIGVAATAQYSEISKYATNYADAPAERPNLYQDRAPGDIINGYSYDFDTPANWDVGTSAWVIGPNGPAGFFSSGMGPITSTSGVDFALMDADGNTGSHVIDLVPTLDFTGYTNVALEFESYFRHFQGQCYFEISINGGTTWTTYQVHQNVLLNESTANPELVSVNISGVAANEAAVNLRFRYESGDDYAWMIDDVAFVEGYDNQLILDAEYMSAGTFGYDYYLVPSSQIMDVTFGADVSNNGLNDQTNTTLMVNIDGGGTYTQTSATATVPAFSSDSLEITTAWTPSGAGSYVVDYLVGSADYTDQAAEDNDDTLETITVGGNVYARDNGVPTGAVSYLGTPPAPPTVMCNNYEIAGDITIGKIQVGISATSVEGEQMYVELRKWNGADYVFEAQSIDHTIGAGEPGTVITLDLTSPVPLVAGDDILLCAGHYGSDDVWFLEAQTAFGAIIYNDGAASQQNSVFIIRGEEVFTGIDEEEAITGLNMYPNPADKATQLTYNVVNEANVAMTITDLSGKVVYTENFGSQTKGEYQVELSTQEFSNGVYFYTLTVGEYSQTKKFVVSH